MATLFDIADVPQTVNVEGKDIPVHGISLESLVSLISRFPELKNLLGGVGVNNKELIEQAPAAVAAVIAAGCGHSGDERAEAVASRLGIGYQLEFIDKIIQLTFPKGVGPFVQKLEEIGVLVQQGAGAVPNQSTQG